MFKARKVDQIKARSQNAGLNKPKQSKNELIFSLVIICLHAILIIAKIYIVIFILFTS
jgi:hypothetical protein